MSGQHKIIIDGIEIIAVVRWANNGRSYVWKDLTITKVNKLIKKYGIDQITADGILWLIT